MEALLTFYVFVIMSIITKFHIYWMQGGLWPGKNKQDFIDKVLGRGEDVPGSVAYIFVILTFVFMALFPIAVYYKVDLGLGSYEKYVFLFLAIIFITRAVGMFIPAVSKRATKVFLEYNSRLYSPLCLSLGVAYFYLYVLYI